MKLQYSKIVIARLKLKLFAVIIVYTIRWIMPHDEGSYVINKQKKLFVLDIWRVGGLFKVVELAGEGSVT